MAALGWGTLLPVVDVVVLEVAVPAASVALPRVVFVLARQSAVVPILPVAKFVPVIVPLPLPNVVPLIFARLHSLLPQRLRDTPDQAQTQIPPQRYRVVHSSQQCAAVAVRLIFLRSAETRVA